MYGFEFERPASIAEAVAALADVDAQVLGGGQTLIPTLKQRLAMPSKLISLGGIAGLRFLRVEGDVVCIGAGISHGKVAREAGTAYPALADLAGQIGDPAVRNRGTIGGSLANNDPSACYPAAALGSGATIVTDRREIVADDFFQGMFTTALEEDEIVTEVRFPVPQRASYQKFVQPASRFALVGVFVAQYRDGVRVAVTGASQEGVFRWAEAEAALDQAFDPSVLEGSKPGADGMIADMHGSAEYRAHLVGVMTRRAVGAACG